MNSNQLNNGEKKIRKTKQNINATTINVLNHPESVCDGGGLCLLLDKSLCILCGKCGKIFVLN